MNTEMQQLSLNETKKEQNLPHKSDETPSLQSLLMKLEDMGGFRLVKSIIRDTAYLDPRKKSQHDIFLNDAVYKETREKLATELDAWISVLEEDCEDLDDLNKIAIARSKESESCLSENLFSVREEIKSLEMSYRGLDSFYANSVTEKTDFLNILNVDKKNLSDYNSIDSKTVLTELSNRYDSLDLKKSYSMVVIPGYLGDAVNVRHWAKVMHKNKALLITDFEDSASYDELIKRLSKASLNGSDIDLSNVVMVCNYSLVRRRSEIANEEDDLYIPSSSAVAGRMYDTASTRISQGIAGKRFGQLNGLLSVRFDMLKSELVYMIDLGVVPVVETDGQIAAFSNRTLYSGPVAALQEYTIVRVFDWVGKVIQQFCNDESLSIWDATVKSELTDNLQAFLTKYKGAGQLYENYNLKEIVQDPVTKNVVVQVELRPFYAAKNFLIELTGKKQQSNMMSWEQKVN